VARLSPISRLWRGGALLAGVVLVVHGTLFGNDVQWPFAPMSQFAFRIGHNDAIHSTFLQAKTEHGDVVRISLSPASVGMARAEVEGQLPNFERDPELLEGLAEGYEQQHPDAPRMVEWYLRDRVTDLEDGRVAGEHVVTLVTWRPSDSES
jgi:hypothetical protein